MTGGAAQGRRPGDYLSSAFVKVLKRERKDGSNVRVYALVWR